MRRKIDRKIDPMKADAGQKWAGLCDSLLAVTAPHTYNNNNKGRL